jgi:hypothetical protein
VIENKEIETKGVIILSDNCRLSLLAATLLRARACVCVCARARVYVWVARIGYINMIKMPTGSGKL